VNLKTLKKGAALQNIHLGTKAKVRSIEKFSRGNKTYTIFVLDNNTRWNGYYLINNWELSKS